MLFFTVTCGAVFQFASWQRLHLYAAVAILLVNLAVSSEFFGAFPMLYQAVERALNTIQGIKLSTNLPLIFALSAKFVAQRQHVRF